MHIDLRNICFIRHAKSSWDYPELADIERPLNGRGNRDAVFMSEKMVEMGTEVDCFLTSPAVRARATANYFADAFNLDKDKIQVVEELYGAGPYQIIDIVQEASDAFESLFVFGHNPAMTELANMFPGVEMIDNVPTCGILQIKTMVDKWSKWSPDVSAFTGFYYPKQYVK